MRLARRELRGGISGLGTFIACLLLGVATIAAIASLAAALSAGIAGNARELLGGDVEAQLGYRPADASEHAFLQRSGRLSEIASMRAMARAFDGKRSSLIELKAVDAAYPLYGDVVLSPSQALGDALAAKDGVCGAVVDPALFSRLDMRIGDTIKIGEAVLQVRGTIEGEPDAAASGLIFGPRVMISTAALAGTKLVQPGALVSYRYRLRLPAGKTPAEWIGAARAAFPDAGWELRSFSQASPDLQRLIDRVALFLSLVGLSTLLVGGVGIGNAVRGHIAAKATTIATFKCLGAPTRLVFLVYISEIAGLAGLTILAALLLGALLPIAIAPLLKHLLPILARPGIYGRPLAFAALYGALTTLLFSLWPIAAIGQIRPAALFRDTVDRARRRVPWAALSASGLLTSCLAITTLASAQDRRVALWFIAGAIMAFGLLWATARAVMLAVGRVGQPRRPVFRIALANLHRPGASTAQVVLSLGIGLTVLVAIALVEGNLRRQIDERLPAAAPAFFFIDIQPAQLAGFIAIVRDIPAARMEEVPMMRGRITRLNGVPVERAPVAPEARWALRSDRGLTYSAVLPKGSYLAAGSWWPRDYQGPPLVSFDAGLARGMGLKVGDTLTVNLLGREITARIANLRNIDWERLGINFTIVFAPGTLEHAPQTGLAAVYLPQAEEEALIRQVTERFPNVSAIHVREALAAVSRVVGLIGGAVRLTALVTLAAGALVLGGAIAAGQQRRIYDAVVLKVLGASRGMILSSYLIEHGLLGLVAGLVAGGLGTIAAYFLMARLMNAEWVFLPMPVLATALLAVVLTVALGFAGTWRALGVKTARHLRNE
ncbi:MAG: FtsX-like permease family protein [Alphaproteobacteria bacterium]|nr:FtsX-like permease family protein [Alphaproteobacteria bacterium]